MATDAYSVLNKSVIDTDLRKEVYQRFFWNKFTGFPKVNPTTQKWTLTGSPIERFAKFKLTGRNQLMISMLRNVYGYGKDGSATLLSNEEDLSFLYAKLFVHLKRQGISLPDEVEAEKINWMKIAKDYQPALVRWFAGYLNSDVSAAIYEGYSRHITAATASKGLGITKRYNKNNWFWDGTDKNFTTNEQTFSYTSATWKQAIVDGLDTLDTADVFNMDLLEALTPMVSASNIIPWSLDGEDIYPLIIHSRQMATLRQSNYWSRDVATAGLRGKTNPIFNYAVAKLGKFLIFVDDVIVRLPYWVQASTLNYFDYSAAVNVGDAAGQYEKVQLPDTTSQDAAGAILVGASAVGETLFSDLEYAKESDDYGMVKSLAAKRFYGFNRMDYFDEEIVASGGTTPTDQELPQSAIINTYVS